MDIEVKKRNGKLEKLDFNKIHKVLFWATEGLKDVNVSDIEVNAQLQLFNGISTSEIHKVLIQSATDLISEENPNYQHVAGRLLMYLVRKDVYNSAKSIPHIQSIIKKNVDCGVYDKVLLDSYDEEELDTINDLIKHERDFDLVYAGARQFCDKYLIQDRSTGEYYETPQVAYMCMAMVFFEKYSGSKRMQYIRKFYNAASQFKINLPTPILCGVRSPNRQYSSCTLIDVGDDLDSIIHSDAAVTKYTAKRAGIGINIGRLRPINSKIRGGEVISTGLIPYLKKITASTRCCTQNGVRGGNATVHYPFWHLEVEDLIVLKNGKGSEDNRVRTMDYSIQLNRLFYERVKEGGNITLFSPHECEDLYEAFFGEPEKFRELYEKYEEDPTKRKHTIKALDLFSTICKERYETGRIYVMNVDHCNTHGPFLDKIYMSNLCQEILLPTTPIQHIDDGNDTNSEIALCVLSGVNMGKVRLNEIPNICDLIVRILDYVIEYQDYPVKAAEKMKFRRSIGVGLTNLAYFLAKRKLNYEDPEALQHVNEFVENVQFYLLKASNDLAKENGACKWFNKTKYSEGILPIDTYNRNVDNLVSPDLTCDWEGLREDILKHGLTNSTLTAIMPSESSALVSNATNGIEPPRELVSFKKSKKGVIHQVVPEIEKYGKYYTTAFEMKNNKGYLNICAVIQKYIDQAISVNNYYNPTLYEGGNLPLSLIMEDIFYHYSLGGKTMYYANTFDGRDEELEKSDNKNNEDEAPKVQEEKTIGCDGGACSL